jgi:hypothetical protein
MIGIPADEVSKMELEYYRDKNHVIVIGLLEDGALINWAIFWNGKARSGRWPKRRTTSGGTES